MINDGNMNVSCIMSRRHVNNLLTAKKFGEASSNMLIVSVTSVKYLKLKEGNYFSHQSTHYSPKCYVTCIRYLLH